MLAIDNMVMCTEKDEFAYHEMIAHVPMNVLDDPKHVLVIGGGVFPPLPPPLDIRN